MKPKIKVKTPAGVKKKTTLATPTGLGGKAYASDQDIRWCPGCGDYSILKQVQTVLAEENIPREEIVFISGIGCSSRFPYYMNSYGMHSIHGRATAIATGLRALRKNLNIWIVTGDGDGLSIGGNHLIHLLRRNFNVNILLFNNEIYGLTKGQYSPTSPKGTINKSAIWGTIDSPFNPLSLALGADATFVSRGLDMDPKSLRTVLRRANQHKGASFVEIYQNCNVFNDGAFSLYADKVTRKDNTIDLDHGQPLIFGSEGQKGIKLDGLTPVIVDLNNGYSKDDLWIHNENDYMKATILSRLQNLKMENGQFPRPMGVIYRSDRPTYEDQLHVQRNLAIEKSKKNDLFNLFRGRNFWEIN